MNTLVTRRWLAAFFAGVIFAVGLGVSGMTDPARVLGFLDFTGAWDPRLGFVMAGAIGLHLPALRLLTGRSTPLLGGAFVRPTRRDVNLRLVLGAAIFGVGWGLAGYCPGPGIVSAVTLTPAPLLFLGGMLFGMGLFGRLSMAFSPGPQAGPAQSIP